MGDRKRKDGDGGGEAKIEFRVQKIFTLRMTDERDRQSQTQVEALGPRVYVASALSTDP